MSACRGHAALLVLVLAGGLGCGAPSDDAALAAPCANNDGSQPASVTDSASYDEASSPRDSGVYDEPDDARVSDGDGDSSEVDPDDAAACTGLMPKQPLYGGSLCDAVVRLDYASRRVLGHRLVCARGEWPGPIADERAGLLAQAALGLDAPPEARMTGLEASFWHASKGPMDPAAFAIVDATMVRVVASGTSSSTGGALDETAWDPPWDSTRCFPEFDVLAAKPVVAPGEPAIDDAVAKSIAHIAWYGPYGAWAEEFGGCGDANTYKASVLRWAPILGGEYAEWIVVLHLGTGCPSD